MSNPTEYEIACGLDDRIEAAITDGIRRGQMETTRRSKQRRRRFTGVILTTVLLFTCMFTIKVSPVFAAMVREIPGLNKFVDLINNNTSDKGIQLALDNDFIQPVGVSDEHNGMKFTVQGIIADDSRMVVFYDIQLPDKDSSVELDDVSLTDTSGKKILASLSYNNSDERKQEDIREFGIQRGTIVVEITQGKSLPSAVLLKVVFKKSPLSNLDNVKRDMFAGDGENLITKDNDRGTEFNVTIPIDREKFEGLQKEYIIGETIQIEGQSITFDKAVVSPLRISLYVDYDKENSKQIFGPGDIQLIDDQGTAWKSISGSMGSLKDRQILNFESPYFKVPKTLTIEGSWFRALNKDQMSVIIDTEKGQLLKTPDEKLDLQGIEIIDKYLQLDFSLKGLDPADYMGYSLFEGEFTDADGNKHQRENLKESTTSRFSDSGPIEQHNLQYMDNKTYKQPLTFTIFNYPAYIRERYKIRIK
ncbi:DUF4179 domain-containing protein [Paenibacillus macquariensis]|uniref:DUF4179 domain-containing protein n=1 Tax=Paenibacillus macquariensis TaxID=948756 RepID=A0ABY1JJ97_9BACL|nr:DUF4179 domain-containing protein [Paenibacillus macquariensis]MEC0089670.1 DUF4179 domain-containing protein [Paenibacillus macquariensis]OAB30847.1 hypothetical protein PMSM_22190 [Paenibacillus macquariensis subsp. macquariensis]SIQ28399.1 protein of unknown function [Paenibacillus macquariensis]